MSIAISVTCALLLLAFFSLAARPILTRRPRPAAHAAAHAYLGLQHQKELTFAAIKELELDRGVGKIAEEDYHEQRRLLEENAISLLGRLENRDGSDRTAITQQIEHDVAQLIDKQNPVGPEIADSESCTGCGARRSADYLFCPQCGAGFSA
jgi:hypothetical protein